MALDDGIRMAHEAVGGSPGRGARVSGSRVGVRRKRSEARAEHIVESCALRATASRLGARRECGFEHGGGNEVWLGLLADALGRLIRRPWKGAVLFERHLE